MPTRALIAGVAAMATVVAVSNILVQFRLGDWLTWGALSYPFAFLITDLMNRLYGPGAARRVILAGFVIGIACSFIGTQIDGAFGPLVTWRIALGSGTAFLAAQLLDVTVFDRLRSGVWWRAPVISSVVGSSVDTALFFTIAFSATLVFIEPGNDVGLVNEILPLLGVGPAYPLWVSLAVADLFAKFGLALLALVPFRLMVTRLATR